MAQRVQVVTGDAVEMIYADAAYTDEETAAAAHEHGIRLIVAMRREGSMGFVLLPRGWVVEGSIAWVSRFRRLALDYEHLPATPGWSPFRRLRLSLAPQTAQLYRRFMTSSEGVA